MKPLLLSERVFVVVGLRIRYELYAGAALPRLRGIELQNFCGSKRRVDFRLSHVLQDCELILRHCNVVVIIV